MMQASRLADLYLRVSRKPPAVPSRTKVSMLQNVIIGSVLSTVSCGVRLSMQELSHGLMNYTLIFRFIVGSRFLDMVDRRKGGRP